MPLAQPEILPSSGQSVSVSEIEACRGLTLSALITKLARYPSAISIFNILSAYPYLHPDQAYDWSCFTGYSIFAYTASAEFLQASYDFSVLFYSSHESGYHEPFAYLFVGPTSSDQHHRALVTQMWKRISDLAQGSLVIFRSTNMQDGQVLSTLSQVESTPPACVKICKTPHFVDMIASKELLISSSLVSDTVREEELTEILNYSSIPRKPAYYIEQLQFCPAIRLRENHQVVAWCLVSSSFSLKHLFVLPEYRHLGLASILLDQITITLHSIQYPVIEADYFEDNSAAAKLFEKKGWTEIGRVGWWKIRF